MFVMSMSFALLGNYFEVIGTRSWGLGTLLYLLATLRQQARKLSRQTCIKTSATSSRGQGSMSKYTEYGDTSADTREIPNIQKYMGTLLSHLGSPRKIWTCGGNGIRQWQSSCHWELALQSNRSCHLLSCDMGYCHM
jgi:hypothetical protein